jgi:transcriptional regulator with XRE-family HTH domain
MRTQDLKKYLAGIPEVTTEDLEALRTAAKKLDQDPSFQADHLKSRFVEEILAAMEENGVNQTELANRWGKTRQYLSKLLNEDRRVNFTIETMCEVAHLLHRRVDILVMPPSEAAPFKWFKRFKSNEENKRRKPGHRQNGKRSRQSGDGAVTALILRPKVPSKKIKIFPAGAEFADIGGA